MLLAVQVVVKRSLSLERLVLAQSAHELFFNDFIDFTMQLSFFFKFAIMLCQFLTMLAQPLLVLSFFLGAGHLLLAFALGTDALILGLVGLEARILAFHEI